MDHDEWNIQVYLWMNMCAATRKQVKMNGVWWGHAVFTLEWG